MRVGIGLLLLALYGWQDARTIPAWASDVTLWAHFDQPWSASWVHRNAAKVSCEGC
jgi:hypothetical protein